MAAKHPEQKILQIGDIVVTDDGLKAMLLKIEEKDRKVSKEKVWTKKAWAVRVTEAERVALAAVLAAMRINNGRTS